MSRPRLLFVSPRFLFPLNEGGKIRTAGILRGMKGGTFDVTLLSPASPDEKAYGPELASVCERFRPWPELRGKRARRVLGLFGPLPVSVAVDRAKAGLRLVADELAKKPNVVVFDFAHAGALMPDRIGAPSVMFTHNIETEILERHAAMATGLWRMIWQRERAKMEAFERRVLRRCDSVIAVSQRDAAGLASRFGLNNVKIIDTGVDLDFYAYHAPLEPTGTVVFSGAMDSRSNIDGLRFLMDDVWPIVTARRPDARMIVAGRNPPADLVQKAARQGLNWQFTGLVDDIRPWVLAGSASVIPLRVGSGTRLKAFESMALGRPVVSTTLGVEGLPIVPGKHFLAAETAEAFGDAIVRLLADPALRCRLAQDARSLLEENLSWAHIARQFEQICVEASAVGDISPFAARGARL